MSMVVAVLSGKGGTGKTTVAANLALAVDRAVQLLDCDVEEPNAHLFVRPAIAKRQKVFVRIPRVKSGQCRLCGKCQEVCAFNAIAVLKDKVLVFPELCHSCGACAYFCPEQAIEEIDKETGTVEIGARGDTQFVNGSLNVGEAVAVPVVRAVKSHLNATRTVIIDAPPGTSCPVIESVRGSDYCVVVTEPTPFGLNDFQLTAALLRELNLPFGVVINRCDLGDEQTEMFCERERIPVLMKIPFQKEIASVYARGGLLVDELPGWRQKFLQLFHSILQKKQ